MRDAGNCLYVIMEHHNGTISGVPEYVLKAFFGGEPGVKIAAENVPHDDLEITLQRIVLRACGSAIRRSEQRGSRQGLTTRHVSHVDISWRFPTVQMVICVVSHTVTVFKQAIEQIRMFFYIFAHTEKSGLHTIVFQGKIGRASC